MAPTRTFLATALSLAALTVSHQAGAVSLGVKLACASDYRAHCSQHAVGSAGASSCMRAQGSHLSKGCRDALAGAGYSSKAKTLAAK